MRLRLLRRRLTISAPRMAVRSAMPWPLRWALAAVVLGFCGAIALWAFEFGKGIAGVDGGAKEELVRLRDEVLRLRQERERAQSVINTSGSLLTAEKAAQERMTLQLRQLEAENRALRDDLGFFERLIPAGNGESIAIRGLQVEPQGDPAAGMQLRWQVLIIQPVRSAPDFNGRLEVTFAGLQSGRPWSMTLPGGAQPLQLQQYRRIEGRVQLPPQAVVKTVVARVLEGNAERAVQTIKL